MISYRVRSGRVNGGKVRGVRMIDYRVRSGMVRRGRGEGW